MRNMISMVKDREKTQSYKTTLHLCNIDKVIRVTILDKNRSIK